MEERTWFRRFLDWLFSIARPDPAVFEDFKERTGEDMYRARLSLERAQARLERLKAKRCRMILKGNSVNKIDQHIADYELQEELALKVLK